MIKPQTYIRVRYAVRTTMRKSVTFALTAVLLLASTHLAAACSCSRNPTAKGILASSSVVFTGIARSSEPVIVDDTAVSGRNYSITQFEVVESFKGAEVGKIISIRYRSGRAASCGVKFVPGTTYTIAAHKGNLGFSTSLCSTWMFQPQVGLGDKLIKEMRPLAK